VTLRARAPAKVNPSLLLGGLRPDGRHELVTVFESVSLCDELELSVLDADAARDQVVCPEVQGPNLITAALNELRSQGWEAPKVAIQVRKRIPVAAGMGGGSADAAATLRLAAAVAPPPAGAIARVAAALGADVPSQLAPGVSLGTGAGELVQPVAPLEPHAFVVVPLPFALSTPDVYGEADRLGLPRPAGELECALRALRLSLRTAGARLPSALAVNDLQRAALSLAPEIDPALQATRSAGAQRSFVCGSGPTVAGLFVGDGALERAQSAAAALADRYAGACAAVPVDEGFGLPQFA
jgi:4-diphosphocytidyl-2-C-methyl-D-erythritol kinase